MSYVALSPEDFSGQVVGSGQCVAFVQAAAKAPLTSFWKQGIKVRGASIAKGTAIATFQDGKYQNLINGDSHAAIYALQDATGIYVWDQWSNHAVSERLIRFKGGKGTPNNDGDAYFVIAGNSDQDSSSVRTIETSAFIVEVGPNPNQLRISTRDNQSQKKSIELYAVLRPEIRTSSINSWLRGQYLTIVLTKTISGLRVHTAGEYRPHPVRGLIGPPSSEEGRWLLLGDVIMTSTELAKSRSLPMSVFSHTSVAELFPGSLLNIGLASPLFGGWGGEFQAEFLGDLKHIWFSPLAGNHWHGSSGNT